MNEAIDIVLASASPRRRQLLEDAGLRFRVHAVDADETLDDNLLEEPLEAVKKLAERKAKAAVEELVDDEYDGTMVVIGSDTMVVLRGEIFGKPVDAADAERILRALSGCGHDVNTAVSVWVVHAPKGQDVGLFYRTFVDTTYVYFKDLTQGWSLWHSIGCRCICRSYRGLSRHGYRASRRTAQARISR